MRKTLLLLVMISSLSTAFSQISFYRLFGGEEFDYAHDVVELPDSSYLVAGTSGSFNVGHADGFLLRVNKYGNLLWSIPYGGPENDGFYDLEHKQNFGTYLMGRTTGIAGDFDAWITFVDDQGSVIWERTYPGAVWEEVTESAMTQDSGLIVGVKRYGSSTQAEDYSIMRLDVFGDTVWTQEVSRKGADEVTNIESYQDSMFLVSSNHWDTLNQQSFGFIELIHEDGSLIWSDTVSISPGSTFINDFMVSNDTLFGVGSFKLDDTSTYNRMRHVRNLSLAEGGEFIMQAYQSAGNMIEDVICPIINNQNKYSAFRFHDPLEPSPYSNFFIGLNNYYSTPLGAATNTTSYGEDRLFHGVETYDGGAVFVGYESLPNGGTAMCILKIGPGFDYPVVPETPFILDFVGQEEIEALNSILVYPNPTSDILNVVVGDAEIDRFALVNLDGKLLVSGAISNSETSIAVEGIQAGMYFLQFYNEGVFHGAKQIIIR